MVKRATILFVVGCVIAAGCRTQEKPIASAPPIPVAEREKAQSTGEPRVPRGEAEKARTTGKMPVPRAEGERTQSTGQPAVPLPPAEKGESRVLSVARLPGLMGAASEPRGRVEIAPPSGVPQTRRAARQLAITAGAQRFAVWQAGSADPLLLDSVGALRAIEAAPEGSVRVLALHGSDGIAWQKQIERASAELRLGGWVEAGKSAEARQSEAARRRAEEEAARERLRRAVYRVLLGEDGEGGASTAQGGSR